MPSLSRMRDKVFYGWIIVAIFLVISATLNGTRYSFGVFFKSIESEFGLSRAATSAVTSAYWLLIFIFAIFAGWALDKYGPRIVILVMGVFTGLSLLLTSQTSSFWQLFITYSLLLSMGTGPLYNVIMATVSRWFDKKRGLALGIGGSGPGLGTFVMAPLATYLISSFGWRMAYIIIGLIAWLIVIPLSRLLRKDPYEIGILPDGEKSGSGKTGKDEPQKEDSLEPTGLSLLQASKNRNFWFFGSIWLLFSFCYLLVLTHIVPHATDMGLSAAKAASVLSLLSVTSIVGRVLMGRVSDRMGRKATAIMCSLLQAGAMVWLIASQDLWMLYIFAVVYGFSFGGLDPPITALIGDTFGLRNIGVIMGALMFGWAVGAAIGPVVGGLIFDFSNSYFMAFLIGAIAMLAVALLVALIRWERERDV